MSDDSRIPFEQLNDAAQPARRDGPQPTNDEYYVGLIRETAAKLLRDGASRADLKLVSTALRELRYSFKVLSAYKDARKVTVFGSARLPASDPAYQAAVEFGRRMADECDFIALGKHLNQDWGNIETRCWIGIGHRRFDALVSAD